MIGNKNDNNNKKPAKDKNREFTETEILYTSTFNQVAGTRSIF